MKKAKLPKNISRCDCATYHGYVLTISRSGARYTRYYPDGRYKTKQEGYKAAMEDKERIYFAMESAAIEAGKSQYDKNMARRNVLIQFTQESYHERNLNRNKMDNKTLDLYESNEHKLFLVVRVRNLCGIYVYESDQWKEAVDAYYQLFLGACSFHRAIMAWRNSENPERLNSKFVESLEAHKLQQPEEGKDVTYNTFCLLEAKKISWDAFHYYQLANKNGIVVYPSKEENGNYFDTVGFLGPKPGIEDLWRRGVPYCSLLTNKTKFFEGFVPTEEKTAAID